jgi:hypothetical protein
MKTLVACLATAVATAAAVVGGKIIMEMLTLGRGGPFAKRPKFKAWFFGRED